MEEVAPVGGEYAMAVAEAWSGTCDLDDPATYEAPEQAWTFDPRGEGSVGGQFVVELDRAGMGSDELQEAYGRRMTFPCRADAAFSGAIP